MDFDKIGEVIKKIRQENNMTQKEFAEKYNVSFQAVSKWECGKNIPDITLLKQISEDYNISLDELIKGNKFKNKNKNNKYFIFIIIFVVLITLLIIFMLSRNNSNIEFKTISSTCNDFKISGSIAYNKNNSHLHLNNIVYCGGDDYVTYEKIECSLYEQKGNIIKELEKCNSTNNKNIKLENYLKDIEFNLDNFSNDCQNYNDDSLYLEIKAYAKDKKTVSYKINLSLNNTCKVK